MQDKSYPDDIVDQIVDAKNNYEGYTGEPVTAEQIKVLDELNDQARDQLHGKTTPEIKTPRTNEELMKLPGITQRQQYELALEVLAERVAADPDQAVGEELAKILDAGPGEDYKPNREQRRRNAKMARKYGIR